MPASDTAFLTTLKTARDAVAAAITEGRTTVEYWIGNRRHRSEEPSVTLQRLEELISKYEVKASRESRSPNRVVSLSRPTTRG